MPSSFFRAPRRLIPVGAIPVVLLLTLDSGPVRACATCGCTLSTDAAMGFTTRPGWRVNLQYDYINQDQLRHGTGTASVVPEGNELEHGTRNDYITTAVSYAPNARWSLNLIVPYVIRKHTTYGEFDPLATLELSGSQSSSPGDVKLTGGYQGFLPTHNLGIQLGVKLPTGDHGDDVRFSSGPGAGEPLDASLQPGTGSTDLVLGAYYYQALSQDFDGFAHVTFQAAVATSFDYRPGNSVNLSTGVRYVGSPDWVPQLQVNIQHKGRDGGENADPDNSIGSFVYLSPGLSFQGMKHTRLYGYVQLPVYQNLDGWQLAPRWTASLGITREF